jgi:hypothetical protein
MAFKDIYPGELPELGGMELDTQSIFLHKKAGLKTAPLYLLSLSFRQI